MAAIANRREGPKAPPDQGRDYQEERALARAVAAAQRFSPGVNEATVAVAISEWVLARASMSASIRMNAELLFNLGDARLRGYVEAALPAIGGSLAHLPAEKPLFDLSQAEVIEVFMAGILGAQEAAVSAAESLGYPFDDEIPFPSGRG